MPGHENPNGTRLATWDPLGALRRPMPGAHAWRYLERGEFYAALV